MESLAQAKHISEALHGIQHMLIGAEKIASNLWTLAMKGTSSQRLFVFSHSSSDCPGKNNNFHTEQIFEISRLEW